MRRYAELLFLALLLSGCEPLPPPPPNRSLQGLPVTGSLAFAQKTGFTYCLSDNTAMRCRREGAMLLGFGPFSGAVDLAGSDGSGGFSQLTLWHNADQHMVGAVGAYLEKQGWQSCRTGTEDKGDQQIYTRKGAAFRISIDLSYWGKRRLRLIPEQGQPTGHCW